MSLDISIHRRSSVEALNSNTCTNDGAGEAGQCTGSLNSDGTNYLNESEPGVYRVEVKMSVSMVVPTTTADINLDVETTKPETTYDTEKDKTSILGKIQRASYTWDDTQYVCSVSNTVPTIRYYNTSHSHTYVEIPLARAEVTNHAGQEALATTGSTCYNSTSFWDKVYMHNSSVIMISPEGITNSNNNKVRSECTQDATLRRNLYDSR